MSNFQLKSKNPRIHYKQMSKRVKGNDWEDNVIDWTTFYRRNIHRFIEHYFQIKLHLYQIIWIYYMSVCDSFVATASRASAKSWLIAVLAVARAVLYPNSEVVIVAKTKKQAGIVFGKIDQLMQDFPNIDREISNFKNSQNDRICNFYNSSKIVAVICDDGGRGERATFTIGEEFRIMDKEKYDSIVRPFAIARQVPYLKNPKYSHLIEEPKEILITSAYYKNLWWYDEVNENIKMMLKGDKAGVIFFDYPIAIRHGIKTKKLLSKDKQKMDMISFQQEYENIPFGENSNAYFKLDMFKKNTTIKKAFYPLRRDNYDKKQNSNDIKKTDGEVRLVSVDIATRKGNDNDNTIIACIRLIPTKKGYIREIVYMESHQGENTILQTLRIKQIYRDFKSDYIVLDMQNAGISIYDQLGSVTKDEDRGIEYDAFTVMSHSSIKDSVSKELRERTLVKNATPVIYPISGHAELNSNIAVDFRDNLQRGMISFLINTSEAEDYLTEKNKEFINTDDVGLKAWYLHPYMQIEAMVNETINLEYTISNGHIRIQEARNSRKDRYVSCAYGSWVASLLEKELLSAEEEDPNDPLVFY